MTRRIVCAAIRKAGYPIICGARHFDTIMTRMIDEIGGKWQDAEQGFIDNSGRFLTRKDALVVAKREGQLLPDEPIAQEGLHSENLY